MNYRCLSEIPFCYKEITDPFKTLLAALTSQGHLSNSDQSNGLGCCALAGLYPGSARRFSYAFLRFSSLSSLLLQYEHVLSRYSPPFRLKSSINSAPFLGLKHFSCLAHVMPPCVLMFMCTRFAMSFSALKDTTLLELIYL